MEIVLQLRELLKQHQWKLVTAESCTGGGVSEVITSVPGSSEWFDRGFVTYSNQAKIEMLGISPQTLEQFGAVSEQTAREMAEGALNRSDAQVSLAVTGIAGPDGGTPDKPVGTVWFAWAADEIPTSAELQHFDGDRDEVRIQSKNYVLNQLVKLLH